MKKGYEGKIVLIKDIASIKYAMPVTLKIIGNTPMEEITLNYPTV